jgi:glycosyltransferase involved in cell wall biosynthesis
MVRVRQEVDHIHFSILGIGDHLEALLRLVEELKLRNQVTFHTKLRPAEELPEFIRKANVGVVPYRNDPFTDGVVPTKLMEYAALGLPSIAAKTTAIANYFDDSMVEFFAPGSVEELARCITRLYTDRPRLAQLARGIEKFNRQYNWTNLGAEYVALVEQLRTR